MIFLYKQVYNAETYEILMVNPLRSTPKERRLCVCSLESDAREIVTALEYAHKDNVI